MRPELRADPPVPPPSRAPADRAELRKRFATGALALPVLAAVIWVGAPAWPLLLAAAGALAALEYYRIAFRARLPREAAAGIAACALLPLLPDLLPRDAAGAAFWVVTAAALGAWLLRLASGTTAGATAAVGEVVGGLLFAGPGLFALAWLRTGDDGRGWIAALLLVTWANDALAYGAGRAFGRHPLAPVVSPGKTWEGLAGGTLGSLAAAALVAAWLLPALPVAGLAVLALGSALVGPLGDLAKSMVKRAHGVKHSGRLLPGHGGLLDRIDSLLWNAILLAGLRAALG